MKRYSVYYILTAVFLCFYSCKTFSPKDIFAKRSAHDIYRQSLIDAKLDQTALGASWISASRKSFANALKVSVPFSETGYFASDRVSVASYLFSVKRGEKISISLQQKPADNFMIYMDLFEPDQADTLNPKLIASKDTLSNSISLDAENATTFLLRLQPELLKSGEFTLTIRTGPSLGFPVDGKAKSSIQSFWGNERDAGARSHEGIDIMAKRNTPVIAAANGTVTRVGLNNLGGKIVFMRPEGKNYSLYYAHLDSQLVRDGQQVDKGDTLGLMGNTGNAITTVPHLHFGIYASGGAIDPLPFVQENKTEPASIKGDISSLNSTFRTISAASLYSSISENRQKTGDLPPGTPFLIEAASSDYYKITLPDDQTGYITSSNLKSVSQPIRTIKLENDNTVYERPNNNSARKMKIVKGNSVQLIGNYSGFYFIRYQDQTGWITK